MIREVRVWWGCLVQGRCFFIGSLISCLMLLGEKRRWRIYLFQKIRFRERGCIFLARQFKLKDVRVLGWFLWQGCFLVLVIKIFFLGVEVFLGFFVLFLIDFGWCEIGFDCLLIGCSGLVFFLFCGVLGFWLFVFVGGCELRGVSKFVLIGLWCGMVWCLGFVSLFM